MLCRLVFEAMIGWNIPFWPQADAIVPEWCHFLPGVLNNDNRLLSAAVSGLTWLFKARLMPATQIINSRTVFRKSP